MVICLFGENCTGKSSIANDLKTRLNAELVTGKDYLRLAKNETDAKAAFSAQLADRMTSGNLVYVVSEPEQLALLPAGCLRVLVTAELPVIKQRFAARMGGRLPAPVESMLERKHGLFDPIPHDLHIHTADNTATEAAGKILASMVN